MAQLVEQRIRNAWVPGSSPGIGSISGVSISGISTSVVHGLPKPVRRVRLPYLAQNISNPGLNPGFLVFINIFSAFYSNKITFFELLHKYN